MEKFFKTLSRNDTGETRSHQSGISIPKLVAKTSVFPQLGKDELNPRTEVCFFDEENTCWKFQYIYYNDIFHGKPKGKGHDEFRMTCVIDFIRQYKIKAGDSIWFGVDEHGVKRIGFVKQENEDITKDKTIVIGSWHLMRC